MPVRSGGSISQLTSTDVKTTKQIKYSLLVVLFESYAPNKSDVPANSKLIPFNRTDDVKYDSLRSFQAYNLDKTIRMLFNFILFLFKAISFSDELFTVDIFSSDVK